MKKLISFFSLTLLLIACDREPEVFSVNNYTMVQDSVRALMGVKALSIPDITGHWTGMGHNIVINITNGVNGLTLYSAGLIDTMDCKDCGTTYFDVDFMTAGGKPYVEVIDWGGMANSHDYKLTSSTYLKINKLTVDTIIVQLMKSAFTEGWLKSKGFKFFVTYEEKLRKDHRLYLTEDLPRLAGLLKQAYHVPQVFHVADTLVRKQ